MMPINEVKLIHRILINEFGGSHGIRDATLYRLKRIDRKLIDGNIIKIYINGKK